MKNIFTLLTLSIFLSTSSFGQHDYSDSFTAQKADSYTIDGSGDEAFWATCDWYDIKYIWIPYGETMATGDFTGRVKFAWTEDKLLVLSEIEDDVLSDTHEDPQFDYYKDDCFEVFLDEDYSGGWHQTSYNAFAYHCAINEEDVIDSGDEDAGNVIVNDHVEYDLDTVDATHYVWELAISIYDDSFNESNASNNMVTLTEEKDMGIAVAYCDNDGGNDRENFIGLINVAQKHYNSAWQDASVFGKLTLKGSGTGETTISSLNSAESILLYQDKHANLVIDNQEKTYGNTTVTIYDINGRIVKQSSVCLDEKISLELNYLASGVYIINVKGENINASKMLSKF